MSLVFWLMIVSMPIVVLPMARSPMISSRWPRPRANSASTTTSPVCTGCTTRSRSMISGAGRSIGSSASVAIGPLPSSGRPSGSTTRPSSAGPTGTRTTSPVPRTASPASTPSTSSSRTQPIRSCSSTWAKPNWPLWRTAAVRRGGYRAGRKRARCRPPPPRPGRSARPAGRAAAAPNRLRASFSQASALRASVLPWGACVRSGQDGAEVGAPGIADLAKWAPCSSRPAMSAGSVA